jgi:hypothetical protein
MVIRRSVWACSTNCTPTFPNGIWGGRIAKNAGKTAVFPPPSPTVRVSQTRPIVPAIFLQLTLQSAKRRFVRRGVRFARLSQKKRASSCLGFKGLAQRSCCVLKVSKDGCTRRSGDSLPAPPHAYRGRSVQAGEALGAKESGLATDPLTPALIEQAGCQSAKMNREKRALRRKQLFMRDLRCQFFCD